MYSFMIIILTIFIITFSEFLMFSNFNSISNLIGTLLLVFGGWLILILLKALSSNKKKTINLLFLCILTLIYSIVLPIIIKYFPYCGGYESVYYAPLSALISIGYTIPYLINYLKQKFKGIKLIGVSFVTSGVVLFGAQVITIALLSIT